MSDTKLREKADALIAFTQQGPRFIAWVEAVTDSIAPEPEKVAKVETMADRIAADLKAGTFRGEQPAQSPAPVAGELPEAVRRALIVMRSRDSGDLWFAADALETWARSQAAAQPVGVGMTTELATVIHCPSC